MGMEISKSVLSQAIGAYTTDVGLNREGTRAKLSPELKEVADTIESVTKDSKLTKQEKVKALKNIQVSVKNASEFKISGEKFKQIVSEAFQEVSTPVKATEQELQAAARQRAIMDVSTQLKNEMGIAKMGGKAELEQIAGRLKPTLASLTPDQMRSLVDNTDLWILMDKVPAVFAENLSAENLGILAGKHERHGDLKKLIEKLPLDDHLYGKHQFMASETTPEIALGLKAGAQKLKLYTWNMDGRPIGSDTVKLQMVKNIEGAVENGLAATKLAEEKADVGKFIQSVINRHTKLGDKSPLSKEEAGGLSNALNKLPDAEDLNGVEEMKKMAMGFSKKFPVEEKKPQVQQKPRFEVGRTTPPPELDKVPIKSWSESEVIDFVNNTLGKAGKEQETTDSLESMDKDSVKLLAKHLSSEGPNSALERLWIQEAKIAGGKSHQDLRQARLEILFANFSDEQIRASANSAKFLEIVSNANDGYSEVAARALSPDHLKIIGEDAGDPEKNSGRLNALEQMAFKMQKDDAKLGEKLIAIAPYVKEVPSDRGTQYRKMKEARAKLKSVVELRMMSFPAQQKGTISGLMK